MTANKHAPPAPLPDDRRLPDAAAPDDLAQAYRDAVALADDGARPAAAVRARVLAAAQAVAAGRPVEDARRADPVASPPVVVSVLPGAGRAAAANRPGWRLQAGAAACIAVLAGVGAWRLQGQGGAGGLGASSQRQTQTQTQVASADAVLPMAPADGPVVLTKPVAPPAEAPAAPVVDSMKKATAADEAAPKAARRTADRHDVIVAQAEPQARVNAAREAPVTPAPAFAAAPPVPAAVSPAPTAAADARATLAARAEAEVDATARARRDTSNDLAAAGAVASGRTADRLASARAPAAVVALAAPPAPPPAPAPVLAPAATPLAPAAPGAALRAAAQAGDLAGLRAQLASGTPVDAPDGAGRSALLQAVLARRIEAVRALLAAGADPARADRDGLTPRAAARLSGDEPLQALLPEPH